MIRIFRKSKKNKTFKDWYAENKDLLSKKRRTKYQDDKDYREDKKRRRILDYRATRGINEDGTRTLSRNGKTYTVIKVSDLARKIGIKPITLRGYFDRAYLPTWHYDDSKLRYVTMGQVEVVIDFVTLCKDNSASTVVNMLKESIDQQWDR